MNEPVLDASVLLAIAKSETYDQKLLPLIEGSVISSVNYAEVLSKLSDLHISASDPAVISTFVLLDRIEPFTASQAQIAADLRPLTAAHGLALGDRACLALALELGAEVYTTDRLWAQVHVGCPIHLIRGSA